MELKIDENTRTLEREDIFVVNANKKHSFQASENILFVKVSILYEMVSDVFQSIDIIYWCDSTQGLSEQYDELREILNALLKYHMNRETSEGVFGEIALCYRLLDILSPNFLVRSSDRISVSEKEKFENRIAQINNYLRSNYNQPVSLNDLADQLYLSSGYLSRFFKKQYGMSFVEYLTNVRVHHAVDELLFTDSPVTRIAFDNGFASVGLFNKAFKKYYGDTPSAIRRKYKDQRRVEQLYMESEETVQRLEKFLYESGHTSEEKTTLRKAEISCSAQNGTILPFVWNQMLNIGSAHELLNSDVQEQMLLLKNMLGIKYVRFWNIFSEHMLIDIRNEKGEYNFSRLDELLDFLTENGMKPFIDLGQMPKRINKNVKSTLLKEDDKTVFFQSMEQWTIVLSELFRHLMYRYGKRELAQWKIEIWKDDRYQEKYYLGETYISNYYDYFARAKSIIKKFVPDIEVGGGGAEAQSTLGYNLQFYQEWKEQGVQPDFISVFSFAYERGSENLDCFSKRSTDENFLKHGIIIVKDNLEKVGWKDVKLYVTEWGMTVSERNGINDTCYKGAYIVKNVIDTIGMTDMLGYFLGSDKVSQFYDSRQLLQGGNGLVTKDGILKPSGYAMKFLSWLYPYYIGKGENHLVTTDGENRYGIICHNQKCLNYYYYYTEEDEINFKEIWKYFENREKAELNITINDVADGLYQMRIYRVNEQAGSVLGVWEELGYHKELSKDDIQYLQKMCEPRLTIQDIEVNGNTADINVIMEANEITFVKLYRNITFTDSETTYKDLCS